MKGPIKFFMFGAVIFFGLILFGFFGDSLLFFLSSADDKLYGPENTYKNASLTGESLTAESNIKDSVEISNAGRNWLEFIIKFSLIILKVFAVVLLPLLLWFLFMKKDIGLLEWFEKTFLGK